MSREKRRQYGTGSVFQRSSDGRWIGVLQVGWNHKGNRRTVRVTAKTEALVKQKLRELQRRIEKDGVPETSTRTTVKSYAEIWLERQQLKLRPKTVQAYASEVRRWIIPTIGNKALVTLTPGDVRAVEKAIRAAGRSSSTAKHAQSVLTSILRAAITDGYQVPERLLALDAPGRATSDRDSMAPEVLQAMLSRVAAEPDGSRWVAALLQGMRQGECLGLTWDCVDFDQRSIDVSWQLQALPRAEAWSRTAPFVIPDGYEHRQLYGALHLVRPKTSRGQRTLPLLPWMHAALLAWREIAPPSPNGLVWPRLDGNPRSVKKDMEQWKALQRVVRPHPTGREWVIHEARHTAATMLLQAGVDPAVITALLGHASIVTSRGYMHIDISLARDAMDKVAARVQLPSRNPSR